MRAALRLLSLVLVASSALRCTQARPAAPDAGLRAFERRLEEIRRELGVPGMSAAIARDGEIVWARGFGYADVENRVPATPETAYHLASLTKTFASTLILQLEKEGKLSLDDPVSRYGVKAEAEGEVLVRHLMTHTSEGVPGAAYKYNGNRFLLLGQVLEKASGQTFAQLLMERIIKPLGLRHTVPNPKDAASFALAGYSLEELERFFARGYASDGKQREEYPKSFTPSAGLISSVLDVARYSMAIDENRFLDAETQERIYTPAKSLQGETLPYGLGWFIQEHEGEKLVWHYGYWKASSSLIVKVPARKLTFVALANSDMLSRPFYLGLDNNVLKSSLGREFVETFVLGRTKP